MLSKTYESYHLTHANDKAGSLNAGKVYRIRLNTSPQGKGTKNEASGGTHLFPEENNIAWIQFTALKSSTLTIRIVPDSTHDDYDVLLFNHEDTRKPLRSNCSRTQDLDGGITGLGHSEDVPEHVGAGTGSPFSRSIDVLRGASYYLVLNNVYEHGGGATIFFEYWDEKKLSGIITDEDKQPLSVVVTWEDRSTGDTLAQTESNSQGYFSLLVPYSLQAESGYSLIAQSDSLIFSETDYSVGAITTCSAEPLSLVLKELEEGTSITFGSINFVGGESEFLTSATPSLKRLHHLMINHPQMRIRIEGHTNGSMNGTQKLSEDRAFAVRSYLIEQGIEAHRITTIGYGGRHLLYSLNELPEYQSKNRRVEIMVTNY